MKLLDPRGRVDLVRVEGLSPADAADDDDRFLGCDLTEYEGGTDFPSSRSVRLVQLKYSTRHPNQAWTAANLAAKPTQGQPIVRRLAVMHAALVDEFGRQSVLDKVTVALVSNRSAATELVESVDAARTLLTHGAGSWTKARLRTELGADRAAELDRLLVASRLTLGRFLDFIRAFDLTGCGVGPRHEHLRALQQGVGDLLLGGVRPGVLGLKDLVSQQVMPEAKHSPGIQAADVLAALGAPARTAIFPYPSSLRGPADRVPTRQAADLAAALVGAPGPLLAHGNLGIGKTTTVLALEAELPTGSQVVIFDCFADGQFHLPNQDRHSYRACLQLANDIGLRIGLAPMVAIDTPGNGQLFDALSTTLAKASPLLPAGALLVLAIDAADNAVVTARERGEGCFVDGLWNMPLPPNVRLLMTARTLRRDDVLGRASVRPAEAELSAFDAAASALMLRRVYHDATDAECEAFHLNSVGVARVQTYALGRSTTTREAVEQARSGLSVIFDEILQTAMSTTVGPAERTRQLAALAVAGRPAATQTIADVLTRGRDEIDGLVRAMRPAMDVVDGRILFADEDFDAHLSSKIAEDDKRMAHTSFAELLWSRRDVDPEAALHVAVHLDGANMTDRLVELARDEGTPDVISDGFVRTRTYRTRVRLAMSRTRSSGATQQNAGESLQLLLAAADAARSDSSLRDTIRASPELATLHADPGAVAHAILHDSSEPWLGKLHLRAAFILARHEDRHDDAREQLSLARAWLRAWAVTPDRGRWDFDADDLAHGALAAFLLGDARSAWALSTHWRPATFVESVTEHVLALAPSVVPWSDFSAELDAAGAATVVKARAAVAYARTGMLVPVAHWRSVSRRLTQFSARVGRAWITEFCQHAVEAGVGRATIRRLLEARRPQVGHLDNWRGVETLLPYLRSRVLSEVTAGREPDAAALRPSHLTKSEPGTTGEGRRVYDELAPDLVALLTASVRGSLARDTNAVVEAGTAALDVAQRVLGNYRRGTEYRFQERSASRYAMTRLAVQVAAASLPTVERGAPSAAAAEAETRLRVALDALPEIVEDAAPQVWVEVAAQLRARGACRGLSDELLRKAAAAVEAAPGPPTERRDLLLRAAAVALDAGDDGAPLSADLFERAVAIASSLDVDIAARLRSLLRLAASEDGSDPDPDLARRLLSAMEAAASKVDEPDQQLPHTVALRAVTSLAPAVGLAAAMRWADEDRLAFDSSVSAAIPAAVQAGELNLDQAFTLLALRQPEHVAVHLLRSTAETVRSGPARRDVTRRRLHLWASRITTDADRIGSPAAARELCAWIDQAGLDAPTVVADMQTFAQARGTTPPKSGPVPSRDWATPTPALDVEALIAEASQRHARQHLDLLRERYVPDEVLSRYLSALAQREEGGRVASLDFIAALAGEPGCHPRVVAVTLAQVLATWPSPSVASWSRRKLPDWTARHLPSLFGYADEPGDYPQPSLYLPSHAPFLLDRVWAELARQLDQLTADQLYAAAVLLGREGVSRAGRRAAVRWALARAQQDQPGPVPDPPRMAQGTPFHRVLLAVLGHEDVRRRWLAARALRDHLRLTGDAALAEQLLGAALAAPADARDEYQLQEALPRPLTTLQWLLIALSQTALEDPALLTPLGPVVRRIATGSELPHAAIRELARSVAMQLAPQPADLVFANRPKGSTVVERSWQLGNDRDDGQARFHFSFMDTLPYWYAPLADVFHGITTKDVAEQADRWITDTWRRTWDNDCKFDPRVIRRRDDYGLYSNDHGALPTIETAQTYLEYHAMMLVAGQLCDTTDIERPVYSDDGDPWVEWLGRFLPAMPWIGDERRPVPAAPLALGDGAKLGRRTGEEASTGSLDGAIIAENAAREACRLDVPDDVVLVHGSTHATIGEHSCSAWVESALVNPAAVPSLISTLQRVPGLPRLPYLNDEGPPWGDEVMLPTLILRGWMHRHPYAEAALDAADPAGFGPGPPARVLPDTDFISDGGPWRRVAWAALDFHRPERRDDVDDRSGAYAATDRAALLEYLAGRDMCLLIHANCRVYTSKRYRDDPATTHEASHSRILWANGREEHADGPVRSRSSEY